MSSSYEEICKKNIKEYGEGSRHLSYFADIYSTRTHFIFEVLQNAEDALSRRPTGSIAGYVHFHLYSDRLEIRHNGAPFNELDVTGICGIGEGTKADDFTQIGKFGIGFKSVYAYTFFPKIHSGNEHFEIRRFVEPHAIAHVEDNDTLIILSFDQPDKRPEWAFREDVPAVNAVREIGDAIRKLGIHTLLFLRHIAEIKWTLQDGTSQDETSGYFARNTNLTTRNNYLREVGILDQNHCIENWRIFSRDVTVKDAVQSHQVKVEIAFLIKDGAVTRADNTELVVFFPTEKETKLGFLIQAPFKTTKARDNIKSDDPANHQMIQAAAQLAADSLNDLRDLGMLNVASYAALPLRKKDFFEGSLFCPVYDRVREALKTRPLLPAHGGGFIKAEEAKLARGKELVELFSPEQISLLFGKENLAWLDEDITADKYPDFYTFIVSLAEGIQITPESLSPKLTAEFLDKQPMDWLIKFIQYAMQGVQSLKKVPLIRLSSGRHVSLFSDKNALPSAWFAPKDTTGVDLSVFHLVCSELVANEPIRKFLEKEDIREIDAAAIVDQCILPLYNGVDTFFDEPIYRDHLRQIRKAYTDANDAAKKQLTTSLNGVEWLACIHASGNAPDKIIWKKLGASDVFESTTEQETWFRGLDSVGAYFLHPSVKAEFNGVISSLVKPVAELTQNLHPYEYSKVTLFTSHGWHKQGLNGFKPDATVVGLQPALDSWNKERASILWNIMLSAPRIISGEIQQSSNLQRLDAGTKEFKYTEIGKLCCGRAWLPCRTGDLCKPNELFLTDLPEGFNISSVSAKVVARKLGMKIPVSRETIGALGFKDEEELRRAQEIIRSPELLREFEEIQRRKQDATQSGHHLPDETSPTSERRVEKIGIEVHDTPAKTTEVQLRTVNPGYTQAQSEARLYLKDQCKYDDGVMFCQLCQKPHPVMLNGEPYFEAVDCISDLKKEIRYNKLALCPNHAAMYKNSDLSSDAVQHAILECKGQKIPLNLAGNEVGLYFTQQHLGDLRAALTALNSEEE